MDKHTDSTILWRKKYKAGYVVQKEVTGQFPMGIEVAYTPEGKPSGVRLDFMSLADYDKV